MKICDKCQKKFIRNDYYEQHLLNHDKPEIKPIEVKPSPPVDNSITLKFKRPVEVHIVGIVRIDNKTEVVINDSPKGKAIEIAGEVIRIARDAYGYDILGG